MTKKLYIYLNREDSTVFVGQTQERNANKQGIVRVLILLVFHKVKKILYENNDYPVFTN